MTDLLERLDLLDSISAIKVTERRREWLTKAKPGDRWGVSLAEGGEFAYGHTLQEAIEAAFERVRDQVVPNAAGFP